MRVRLMMAVRAFALLTLVLGSPTIAFSEDSPSVTLAQVRDADAQEQDPLGALVRLWEQVRAAADTPDEVRTALHDALRRRWIEAGGYSEAAPHSLALARERGTVEDRVIHPEVLLGAIEARLRRGPSISANISPLLADLLGWTVKFSPKAGSELSEAQRARIVFVRGRGLFLRNRMDDAVAWLKEADIASLPSGDQPRLWDLCARSHYQGRRFALAAEAFAKGGNRPAAAAAWSAAKDATKTATLYVELLAERPNDETLARTALQAVRAAGATEDFLKRLETLPKDARETPVLLETRGRLLDGAERTDEALALWRALFAKSPNRPGIRAVLARALLAGPQGSDDAVLDEVLGLLEDALQADPNDQLASRLLSNRAARDYSALWRDGPERPRYRRCLRAQRALVAARPDDAMVWGNLGNTLRVGGRADEALKAYERAREENPYDPAIVSDMGLVLSAMGRSDAALAAFEESVRLDPGHLAGRQNAARMLWRAGRDAEAAAHLAIGARTARARGQTGMTYRVLMDRTWRTRRNPRLR